MMAQAVCFVSENTNERRTYWRVTLFLVAVSWNLVGKLFHLTVFPFPSTPSTADKLPPAVCVCASACVRACVRFSCSPPDFSVSNLRHNSGAAHRGHTGKGSNPKL